jgi:diguanylate cyclase (GGDEF)-like protein
VKGSHPLRDAWKLIRTVIPASYKTEFTREILQENSFRLTIISSIVLVFEACLLLLSPALLARFNVYQLILWFVIINLGVVPILWLMHFRFNTIHWRLVKSAQHFYSMMILVFCALLALLAQTKFDFVHVYLMAVLAISAILYTMPIEQGLQFAVVNVIFAGLLPRFQPDFSAVQIIRINTLIFNIVAWLLGRTLLRMKLETFLDKKRLLELNNELRELVKIDSMTGLNNHETIVGVLHNESMRARRIGYPLSIILADIDNFKAVNDLHGHLVGDSVIRGIAHILLTTARSTDTVGRYGGEEFLLIMPDTDLANARSMCERIQTAVRSASFEQDVRVSLSYGISQFEGETIDEFIGKADRKLYAAKAAGKDRFVV